MSAKGSTRLELERLLLNAVSTPLNLRLVKGLMRTPHAKAFFRTLLLCRQYSVSVLNRKCTMTLVFERLYRAQLAQLTKADGPRAACTTLAVPDAPEAAAAAENPIQLAARRFLARLRLSDPQLLELVHSALEANVRLYYVRPHIDQGVYLGEMRRTLAALFELGVPLRLGYGAGERYNPDVRWLLHRRVRTALNAAGLEHCEADESAPRVPLVRQPLLLPSDDEPKPRPSAALIPQDDEPNPFE
jgi:hypothetical protein